MAKEAYIVCSPGYQVTTLAILLLRWDAIPISCSKTWPRKKGNITANHKCQGDLKVVSAGHGLELTPGAKMGLPKKSRLALPALPVVLDHSYCVTRNIVHLMVQGYPPSNFLFPKYSPRLENEVARTNVLEGFILGIPVRNQTILQALQ